MSFSQNNGKLDKDYMEFMSQQLAGKNVQQNKAPEASEVKKPDGTPSDTGASPALPAQNVPKQADGMAISADEQHLEREVPDVAVRNVMGQVKPGPTPYQGPVRPRQAPKRSLSKATQRDEDADKPAWLSANKSGVQMARALMPRLSNNTDAIDAVLCMLFPDIEVKPVVRESAEELKKKLFENDALASVQDLSKMQRQLLAVEQRNERFLRELQLAAVYLLGDRLNYDVGISQTPSQVDFLWPQYDLLYRRLLSQSEQFRREQDAVDGRELYEAKSNGRDIKL